MTARVLALRPSQVVTQFGQNLTSVVLDGKTSAISLQPDHCWINSEYDC